jgi:hypothetical protein
MATRLTDAAATAVMAAPPKKLRRFIAIVS